MKLQTALGSLLLNSTIGFRRSLNAAGKERCLLFAVDLMQLISDPESQFRLLVAIGTAVTDDGQMKEMARSMELPNFLHTFKSSTVDKVQNCAEQLLTLFDS